MESLDDLKRALEYEKVETSTWRQKYQESVRREVEAHAAGLAEGEAKLAEVREELAEARERKKDRQCPDCGFQLESNERDINALVKELEEAEAKLAAMTENRDHWKASSEQHSDSATEWHGKFSALTAENKRMRAVLEWELKSIAMVQEHRDMINNALSPEPKKPAPEVRP